MSRRVGGLLGGLAIAALIIPARGLSAQRCIGTTAYVVRDEVGAVMSAEQMTRLTVRSVNGIALQLRTDSVEGQPRYYAFDKFDYGIRAMRSERVVASDNPLTFGALNPLAFCGGVEDLTLAYAGRTMRLLFDLGEHNTYYEIESPPFQGGTTFRLRSLRCRHGARPPRIDNRTTGKCLVPADSWERTEEERAGRLVVRPLAGGVVDSTAESCRSSAGGLLEAITTQRDWETTWKAYPSVAGGNPLPKVDFATQLVLVVYRPIGPRSVRVGQPGDLTWVRRPDQDQYFYDPIPCLVLYEAVDRNDVRSINGRPLPAALRR